MATFNLRDCEGYKKAASQGWKTEQSDKRDNSDYQKQWFRFDVWKGKFDFFEAFRAPKLSLKNSEPRCILIKSHMWKSDIPSIVSVVAYRSAY